jgi:hypothetical protein
MLGLARVVLIAIVAAAALSGSGCAVPAGGYGRAPSTLAEAAQDAPTAERRASIELAQSAREALDRGDPQAAQVLAERALRVDGRNPYAYLVLGEISRRGERPVEALRHLEQAEALFVTEDPQSRLFRARGLEAQAELLERSGDRAGAELRRAEARQLRDPNAW